MPTVRLGDFEWDEAKAAANLAKHGVSFVEALEAFLDPHGISAADLEHSDRFVLIGMSRRGRVLFVVSAERGESIRIVSARRASPSQRRVYEHGRKA